MGKKIDLHVHSDESDGTFTPEELVEYAKQKGISAFALTDHDTVSGIERAVRKGKEAGIEVIPGIELSSEYHGVDIHILGFYLEYQNEEFCRRLIDFQHTRDVRNEQMAEKLRKQGFSVTIRQMRNVYGNAVFTRAHFAKYLFENGYVKSIQEAFEKYLGKNCPCYVPRTMITPEEAIGLIRMASGIPVLAHPLLYHMEIPQLRLLVKELKQAGLMGIETLYSMNTQADDIQMEKLAGEYHLFSTGGSDFHGTTKPHIDLGTGRGNLYVPYELLEKLKDGGKC